MSTFDWSKATDIIVKPYFQLSEEQLNKVGNTMLFLSEKISGISKTKLLKLLYMLDEFSISKSGIPFLNLQYKVWTLGPVAEEILFELSDKPDRFKKYIKVIHKRGETYIYPKSNFCDDEFSDNDIELLESFSTMFSKTTAQELIKYTHRPNSPWRIAAENAKIYEKLERGEIKNTDIVLDMGCLVRYDERKKSIFEHYIEEY